MSQPKKLIEGQYIYLPGQTMDHKVMNFFLISTHHADSQCYILLQAFSTVHQQQMASSHHIEDTNAEDVVAWTAL